MPLTNEQKTEAIANVIDAYIFVTDDWGSALEALDDKIEEAETQEQQELAEAQLAFVEANSDKLQELADKLGSILQDYFELMLPLNLNLEEYVDAPQS